MTLEEYKKKYLETDDTDFETPTKELVEAWLDDKIEAHKAIINIGMEHGFSLVWGDYNESSGDFENEIMACGFSTSFFGLQIYSGIKLIADILGKKLEKENRKDTENKYEYSFLYKGVKVFEISNEELTND